MDNNNSVVSAIVEAAKKASNGKWDYSKLPTVQQASCHVVRNARNGDGTSLEAKGYIVYVQCGGKWRPANEVLHFYGFKTATAVFTTLAKAEEYAAKIKSTWGVEIKKSEKAERKARKASEKELAYAKLLGVDVETLRKMVAEEVAKKAVA